MRRFDGTDIVIIAVLVMIFIVIFTALLLGTEANDDRRFRCIAEDEVPVEVLDDAFDFQTGDHLCIHIDKLR